MILRIAVVNPNPVALERATVKVTLPAKKLARHGITERVFTLKALEGNTHGVLDLGAARGPNIVMAQANLFSIGPNEKLILDLVPDADTSPFSRNPFPDIASKSVGLVTGNDNLRGAVVDKWEVLEESDTRRVLFNYGRILDGQAVFFNIYYQVQDSSRIQYEGGLIFSDTREGSALTLELNNGLGLACPVALGHLKLDFIEGLSGLGDAAKKSFVVGDNWFVPLHDKTWLGDGQGIAWQGSILTDVNNVSDTLQHLLEPLVAVATPETWNGYWGPGQEIPWPTHAMRTTPQKMMELAAWEEELFDMEFKEAASRKQTYFTIGKFGCHPRPADAGGQNDFAAGNVGGNFFYIPHGDTLHVKRLRYSMVRNAFMRPVHFREQDCTRVAFEKHPNLVYYYERPHFHPSVSPDQLGKAPWTTFPYNGPAGLQGHDQEHDSMNQLFAVWAWTGDYLWEISIRDRAEDYLFSRTLKKGWYTTQHGPLRSFRQEQVAALCHWILGDNRLAKHFSNRLDQVYKPILDKNEKILDLGVYLEGDDRMLGRGNPHWPVWESTISFTGPAYFYSVFKGLGWAGPAATALDLTKRIVKQGIEHGILEKDGDFFPVKAWEWRGADQEIDPNTWAARVDDEKQVWSWYSGISRACVHLFPSYDKGKAVFKKLVDQYTTTLLNDKALYMSVGEWFCCNPWPESLNAIDPVA